LRILHSGAPTKLSQSSLSRKNFQSLITPCLTNRNGTGDWNGRKLGVVYRGSLMVFVERPEHDSIFDIRRNCKQLEDGVEDAARTISRQVGKNDDDHLVVRVVAVSRFSIPEQALVAVHELDNMWHARPAICSGASHSVLRSKDTGTKDRQVQPGRDPCEA